MLAGLHAHGQMRHTCGTAKHAYAFHDAYARYACCGPGNGWKVHRCSIAVLLLCKE